MFIISIDHCGCPPKDCIKIEEIDRLATGAIYARIYIFSYHAGITGLLGRILE